MIRTHQDGTTVSCADYSLCENYRYSLTRTWDAEGRRALFIMLNPSTATELRNDPTVERCERRARVLGCGAFRVVNIFAWRATDPAAMRAATDPVGPLNDAAIRDGVAWVGHDAMIVAAWGNHGAHLGRGKVVAGILLGFDRQISTFGMTKGGHPRHPLYVSYATAPERCAAHALTNSYDFVL